MEPALSSDPKYLAAPSGLQRRPGKPLGSTRARARTHQAMLCMPGLGLGLSNCFMPNIGEDDDHYEYDVSSFLAGAFPEGSVKGGGSIAGSVLASSSYSDLARSLKREASRNRGVVLSKCNTEFFDAEEELLERSSVAGWGDDISNAVRGGEVSPGWRPSWRPGEGVPCQGSQSVSPAASEDDGEGAAWFPCSSEDGESCADPAEREKALAFAQALAKRQQKQQQQGQQGQQEQQEKGQQEQRQGRLGQQQQEQQQGKQQQRMGREHPGSANDSLRGHKDPGGNRASMGKEGAGSSSCNRNSTVPGPSARVPESTPPPGHTGGYPLAAGVKGGRQKCEWGAGEGVFPVRRVQTADGELYKMGQWQEKEVQGKEEQEVWRKGFGNSASAAIGCRDTPQSAVTSTAVTVVTRPIETGSRTATPLPEEIRAEGKMVAPGNSTVPHFPEASWDQRSQGAVGGRAMARAATQRAFRWEAEEGHWKEEEEEEEEEEGETLVVVQCGPLSDVTRLQGLAHKARMRKLAWLQSELATILQQHKEMLEHLKEVKEVKAVKAVKGVKQAGKSAAPAASSSATISGTCGVSSQSSSKFQWHKGSGTRERPASHGPSHGRTSPKPEKTSAEGKPQSQASSGPHGIPAPLTGTGPRQDQGQAAAANQSVTKEDQEKMESVKGQGHGAAATQPAIKGDQEMLVSVKGQMQAARVTRSGIKEEQEGLVSVEASNEIDAVRTQLLGETVCYMRGGRTRFAPITGHDDMDLLIDDIGAAVAEFYFACYAF